MNHILAGSLVIEEEWRLVQPPLKARRKVYCGQLLTSHIASGGMSCTDDGKQLREWLLPVGTVQPSMKAKRKLCCVEVLQLQRAMSPCLKT